LKVEVTVELAKAEAYRLVGICHTQCHRKAGRDGQGEQNRVAAYRIARTWAERRAETTLLEADRENMVGRMRDVGEKGWRG
jgi:hypothetical protein